MGDSAARRPLATSTGAMGLADDRHESADHAHRGAGGPLGADAAARRRAAARPAGPRRAAAGPRRAAHHARLADSAAAARLGAAHGPDRAADAGARHAARRAGPHPARRTADRAGGRSARRGRRQQRAGRLAVQPARHPAAGRAAALAGRAAPAGRAAGAGRCRHRAGQPPGPPCRAAAGHAPRRLGGSLHAERRSGRAAAVGLALAGAGRLAALVGRDPRRLAACGRGPAAPPHRPALRPDGGTRPARQPADGAGRRPGAGRAGPAPGGGGAAAGPGAAAADAAPHRRAAGAGARRGRQPHPRPRPVLRAAGRRPGPRGRALARHRSDADARGPARRVAGRHLRGLAAGSGAAGALGRGHAAGRADAPPAGRDPPERPGAPAALRLERRGRTADTLARPRPGRAARPERRAGHRAARAHRHARPPRPARRAGRLRGHRARRPRRRAHGPRRRARVSRRLRGAPGAGAAAAGRGALDAAAQPAAGPPGHLGRGAPGAFRHRRRPGRVLRPLEERPARRRALRPRRLAARPSGPGGPGRHAARRAGAPLPAAGHRRLDPALPGRRAARGPGPRGALAGARRGAGLSLHRPRRARAVPDRGPLRAGRLRCRAGQPLAAVLRGVGAAAHRRQPADAGGHPRPAGPDRQRPLPARGRRGRHRRLRARPGAEALRPGPRPGRRHAELSGRQPDRRLAGPSVHPGARRRREPAGAGSGHSGAGGRTHHRARPGRAAAGAAAHAAGHAGADRAGRPAGVQRARFQGARGPGAGGRRAAAVRRPAGR